VYGAIVTSCTVPGLTNGDTYYFTVVAANSYGFGLFSSDSNTVIPLGFPGAPTGATAAAGNASATVSWTDPASNGGSAITFYRAVASDLTSATNGGQYCIGNGASAMSCTVSGLTNGDTYYFIVAANNSTGLGPFSSASNNITPAPTVPAAPTGVTAIAGDTSAVVTWTDPASNGGSAITEYLVTADDVTNPLTAALNCAVTGATATSCTVNGLTNGDVYFFRVAAINVIGQGALSSNSNRVVPMAPRTVPGAPTGVSATVGNASAIVTWTDPASNGGSVIILYSVLAHDSTTSANGGESCTASGATATSCTVNGLTNGDVYYFTVAAENAVGLGLNSAASPTVTPGATVPGAPTGVTATAGMNMATVYWTDPASNGGSVISYYYITATDSTNALHSRSATAYGASATSYTITGLTSGENYSFTVAAENSAGLGPMSGASPTVVPA
jgi:hypothetical protein